MSSPSTVPAHTEDASKGHFQLGERVEARFGGKSKWFPGKIRRARERPDGFLYDIVYDDGDSEEAVFAGRVRRPGQAPPSPRPGWAVDVKLARKGKGYHAGTLGRVNDDSSIYVKLSDGDAEWSVPAKNVILHYTYEQPATVQVPQDHSEPESTRDEQRGSGNDASNSEDSRRNQASKHVEDKQPYDKSVNPDHGVSQIDSTAASPIATANPTTRKPQSTASLPGAVAPSDTSNNGLGWIEEVAKSIKSVDHPNTPKAGFDGPTRVESRQAVLENGSFGSRAPIPKSGFSPVSATIPRKTSAAVLAGGEGSGELGMTTPRTISPIPNMSPSTPPHLEWRPSKTRTEHRRWSDSPSSEEIEERRKREKYSYSPDPNRRVVPGHERTATDETPTATHTIDPTAQAANSATKVTEINNVEDVTGSVVTEAAAGATTRSTEDSREDMSSHLNDSNDEGLPLKNGSDAGNSGNGLRSSTGIRRGVEASLEQVAEKSKRRTASYQRNVIDNMPSSGEQNSAPGASSESIPTETVHSSKSVVPEDEEHQAESVMRDAVRLSIQRRYAAEAMHLAEEVRLLKATLRAADDNTHARLQQHERQLRKQFAAELESEREQTRRQLGNERATSARRLQALKAELEATKKCLVEERARHEQIISKGYLGPTAGCRPKVSPARSFDDRSQRTKSPSQISRRTGTMSVGHIFSDNDRSKPASRNRSTSHIPRSNVETRCFPLPPPPLPSLPRRTSNSIEYSPDLSVDLQSGFGVRLPQSSRGDSTTESAGDSSPRSLEAMVKVLVASLAARDKSIQDLNARMRGLEQTRQLQNEDHCKLIPTVGHDGCSDRESANQAEEIGRKCPHSNREGQGGTLSDGPRKRQEYDAAKSYSTDDNLEDVRWRMETERRAMRLKLEAMRGQVERTVGQFKGRVERAEAWAVSAEDRAMTKAARYLQKTKSKEGEASGKLR
ncbi:unnamed protein product [Sphacelaria rigidula]